MVCSSLTGRSRINGGSAFDELDLFGGTTIVNTNLVIGTTSCSFPGSVFIAGGSLYVTNAAHDATVNVRSGTLELDSGTLVIDKLVITNTCGRLIHTAARSRS